MYPNPQDVLPLPAHPDADQYRKRAKDLAKACASGRPGALHEWASRWLNDLARLAGQDEAASGRYAERLAGEITEFAHAKLTRAGCALSEAQFVIARAHGFESWPKLMRHMEELPGERTGVAAFERAADAIVRGDLAALQSLVREDPGLPHARSMREHHATLLHYVSANGVENYRQKTPANIVEIAKFLLDAGAEVDAKADVYGGGATTLGLVITSAHPRLAGVQNALADLLLDRGARLEPGFAHGCLMNGCPEVAEHLVKRGAGTKLEQLTLEEATGLGRMDLVERLWESSDAAQRTAALMMAAWYGRNDAIRFMLDHGTDPDTRHAKDGDTALHVAAYNGNPELVELLLERGAKANVIDDVYGTPPFVWALHAWLVEGKGDPAAHKRTLRVLFEKGATVKPEWIDDARLREDAELWSLLSHS